MDAPPTGPEHTKRLVDLITLALASSDVGKTLKPETIKQFVQFRLRDVYDGKQLDLGPLWTALLAEPGMSEFKLAPPFLLLLEWAPRMKTPIIAPKPLAGLDRSQSQRHLTRITVKASDLDALLYPSLPPVPEAPPEPAPAAAAAKEPAAAPARTTAAMTARHKAIIGICTVVLVAALVYLGVVLFGRHGAAFPTAKLDPILKVTDARRVGYSVNAVISDGRWDAMSPDDRTKALAQLFKIVEADGVKSLVLRDAAGNSRAVASSLGGERSLRVQ